jgi:hypothetical protein
MLAFRGCFQREEGGDLGMNCLLVVEQQLHTATISNNNGKIDDSRIKIHCIELMFVRVKGVSLFMKST